MNVGLPFRMPYIPVPLHACILTLWLVICMGMQVNAVEDDDQRQPQNVGASVSADHAQKSKQGTLLFKKTVRSLLTTQCLKCHGGESVKADFDLSTRAALMASGYVQETAEDSHLFQVISHTAEPVMPLKAEKLPDEAIEVIRQWIDLGAPYDKPLVEGVKVGGPMVVTESHRKFWSFLPLRQVAVPTVSDDQWCRTVIDHFILARQEAAGLQPNPDVDPRTLMRRGAFDLLGLPATSEQVDSFVATPDDAKWSGQVQSLLESPRYGERWARHWMDVARFAESHGYEQDYDRPHAYHYRDFLIRAFNDDLPFNRFLEWQLAGDELDPKNPQAMMATGFLGAGVFPTQLTEAEFESARYDELDDMVTTTGVAFLGLSVGCARCHDHKFDPIPSRDYYRMAATFTTAIRSEIDLDLEPKLNAQRKLEHVERLAALEDDLKSYQETVLAEAFTKWIAGYDDTKETTPWQTLSVLEVKSSGGSKFEPQNDGSWLAVGKAPDKDEVTIVAESNLPVASRLRIEALTHASLPRNGPGRADNGNFALGNVELALLPNDSDQTNKPVVIDQKAGAAQGQGIVLNKAAATHQQNTQNLSVMASIDQDPVSGWAVDSGGIGKDQAAVFEFAQPVEIEGKVRWKIRLLFNHPNQRHAMGRFRIALSGRADAAVEVGSKDASANLKKALREAKKNRDPHSKAWEISQQWYATTLPAWQAKKKELEDLRKKGDVTKLTKVMVTSEGLPHMKHHADGRGFPHFYPQTHLLNRGDVQQKQEVVTAGFLQALTPENVDPMQWVSQQPRDDPRTSFRRATLANWMTDVQLGAGALVARVIVNRVWQHHFGRGLVATPNDFGVSGDEPSHPELLEWLANDLVSHGWQLKRLHHLIMTSSVYRQSTAHDEKRAKLDRENQLLWRWQPRRLEGEVIRDSMLAVSGQLDSSMYGPGTLDQNMKRRSIYFFIKRSKLIPVMMLFDWPEHLVSIGRRSSTTVAPQALMFLNSPQGRKYSESFASRLKGVSVEDAVVSAYRAAFARDPTRDEARDCAEFVGQQEAVYKQQKLKDSRRAALTDLCQALMSASEFIYVE
ncbi:PSD1 and planctomycete cytochrome C domain-containing protein [bacterium]|nr:PSD1 and planctomycete cytochrome C domain-containing protein [bacterium]